MGHREPNDDPRGLPEMGGRGDRFSSFAAAGLPEDRIRFHTCYGVNFGPRVSDLQLENILDLIFTIPAGAYSFEAANPRHEHEWRVIGRIKLREGKLLIYSGFVDSHE